jgi:hypothetical protein
LKTRKKIDRQSEKRGPTKSVKGLENIASLIVPVAAAAAPEDLKKPKHLNTEVIINKTMNNLKQFVNGSATDLTIVDAHNRKIVTAAVREALNLGHALAVGQNDMVEKLLEQQYKARTDLTVPVVVAAVMEQLGMTELLLDLGNLSTVFTRCRLEQSMVDESVAKDYIDYRLRYLADDEGAGDNTFALKA